MDRVRRPLKVLQVSTADIVGGANMVAWNLFQAYRRQGLRSWLAVRSKLSNDPEVMQIPNDDARNCWARFWLSVGRQLETLASKVHGAGSISYLMTWIGQPTRYANQWKGREDFDFPETWHLLELPPEVPDLIHCHNLHDHYFDLRALPWLSHQVPVILTLHDAWLLSGHCAHSFDCERWKSGCGECPDLTIHPPIRRDATAYNWQRKRGIYAKSHLYISTPSQWLMDRVEQSILAPAIVEARVIPNGVDLEVFHPYDQIEARKELGLPLKAKILLFVAGGVRRNRWKDYKTFRAAVSRVARSFKRENVLFIALGESASPERIGQVEVRFIPHLSNPSVVARYYQAADLYVHSAHVETFPTTVLEALACGKPVVATAVGGIPEQIEDGVSGFLVPPGNAEWMASRIVQLLCDDEIRREMGVQATRIARTRFSLMRQVNGYLNWYEEILEKSENA